MSGSSKPNENFFDSNREDGGQAVPPNNEDGLKEVSLDSKLQRAKGMQPEKEGSKSKDKKKKGSQARNKKLVDIDEYSLGGIKYKLPGKRQRVIVASVVLGLNILLVLAVILYFKNPNFQDFIYHVGRNI